MIKPARHCRSRGFRGHLTGPVASTLFCLCWLSTAAFGHANAANDASAPEEIAAPSTESPGLTLAEAEGLALASHPQIAEAAARVRAARYHCVQVGLPPNPTAGYVATEVGNEGQAGQQGFYVGQQFIRGNKLGLNRAVACREVIRLEQELAAQQMRVLTTVRVSFVEAYLAQREVDLATSLVEVSTQARASVQDLLDAKEARKTDLLQAEIEQQRISARRAQAQANLDAAWRRLAAAVGQAGLEPQRVEIEPDKIQWPHGWQQTLDMLLTSSPEVASAMAEVERAQAAWRRARAEPIPDLNTQLAVQYDDATQDTVASIQLGAPIPLWNRNQGGIGKAGQEVVAARRQLEAVEVRLSRDLATTFQQYEASQARAVAYREEILSRAEQNLGLVRQAFSAGEASFLDLLTVQRTYFESNLDYLETLGEVSRSVQLLNGLLLDNESN